MKWPREKINYYSIMFEGIFNLMAVDLMGFTSIIPLFLIDYGASTVIVGMMTTTQGLAQASVPFLLGGIAIRARSKRKLSIGVNSLTRGAILLIPILLLSHMPNRTIITIFLFIMLIYFLGAPLHGLSWNYLLSDCISDRSRSKLLGVLFAISGIVSFGTSYYIKLIRDAESLSLDMKYFFIFGGASIAFVLSVMAFLPLKENAHEAEPRQAFNLKEYLTSIITCYGGKDFKKLLRARFFSRASMILNSFLFVFASSSLGLEGSVISNLIIIQTIGVIVGGLTTGHIAAKFGVKRMLILLEVVGLSIPAMASLCFLADNTTALISACVFAFGFHKSGILGYSNYVIEVVERKKVIHHVIASGLILLPLSFLSTLAGIYIQNHTMLLIFIFQMIVSIIAIILCSKLRLVHGYGKDMG